ncbi:hypothetical protein [Sporomusa aerivorans]|uniref:hypothetical protein n=1 Tax=Sporomusa aerivorans TaxID=204936 RepID=UPI003529DF6C
MTTYKVIINGRETGETVTAGSYEDAYFDVASTVTLTYDTTVDLIPVANKETTAQLPG